MKGSVVPWWTARAVLAIVLASGVVVAATLLFFHTIPFVPNAAPVASNCPSASLVGNATVNATSGWTYYGCTLTSGAVQVNQAGASVLESNTLSAPYRDLYLIPANGAVPSGYGSCGAFPGAVALPLGTAASPVTLPATGPYFYCADYSGMGATGLPSFTVSWYP